VSSIAPERAGPLLDGSNHAIHGPSQAQSQPLAEDVCAQLERPLASPNLDLPARKFLRSIVEETWNGHHGPSPCPQSEPFGLSADLAKLPVTYRVLQAGDAISSLGCLPCSCV
jgi:hypothetical protein